uniref:Pentraxin (PTX) domain-containing protein n=1 Tax=Xiphophorus couchianus TaxID=32473 RepID=A0A3B5LQ96_9TELE
MYFLGRWCYFKSLKSVQTAFLLSVYVFILLYLYLAVTSLLLSKISLRVYIFFSLGSDSEFSVLRFPKESHEGFARVRVSFPAMSSVSVCVRVQWDTEWTDVSTVFSYAAPVLTNEFQLRGRVDTQGRIHLALIIHGKHFPYKASFANDGAWHHTCVTWSRMSNHWAIYVDGDRKDMGSGTDMDRDIHGDGILILGQDQDSFGGNFTEPFFGNITDLNVWNVSLETRHVRALNLCSATIREKLFSWNLSLIDSHHVVKEVKAPLFCPGRITVYL